MDSRLHERDEVPPAMAAMMAARKVVNIDAVTYLGGLLACFIGVLTINRVFTIFTQRILEGYQSPSIPKPFIHSSRFLRSFLLRKVPLLPSAGHAWVCISYVALNIVLIFKPLLEGWTSSWMSHIGSRAGWLTISNVCLTIFLSLKNTPLAPLTGWTYERIHVFHRVVGYITLFLVTLHGATYTAHFLTQGQAARLRVTSDIFGMVAGGCILTLVSAATFLRQKQYELFYVLHVSLFMATMVLIGLHQPYMVGPKFIVPATIMGAGIWVLDRLVRVARVLFYSSDNAATLYPLPNGGTRVVLRRAPSVAKPGEHCFVWIPKIRMAEMHPFSIVSLDPLEFVVSSAGGFTKDLHQYATRNPGACVRASIDGPYGKRVDLTAYDTVVMIAGGGGASYPLALALDMHRRARLNPQQRIVLVWAVRDYGCLQWYWDHLATISNTPNLSASIFITGTPRAGVVPASAETPSPGSERQLSAFRPNLGATEEMDVEKLAMETPAQQETDIEKLAVEIPAQPEKGGSQPGGLGVHVHGIPVMYGRPPVSALIRAEVEQTGARQRVLVLGCGPDGLMAEVREVTARCITGRGPAVDLHCEKFGL